jgi:hypothetical protein
VGRASACFGDLAAENKINVIQGSLVSFTPAAALRKQEKTRKNKRKPFIQQTKNL